jgi:hypothetical protein
MQRNCFAAVVVASLALIGLVTPATRRHRRCLNPRA